LHILYNRVIFILVIQAMLFLLDAKSGGLTGQLAEVVLISYHVLQLAIDPGAPSPYWGLGIIAASVFFWKGSGSTVRKGQSCN